MIPVEIQELSIKKKMAAFTCDLEEDYGFRTGTMYWLEERVQLEGFFNVLRSNSVPITGYVVGNLLGNCRFTEVVKEYFDDVQPHSYSHITSGTEDEIKEDIGKSINAVAKTFDKEPLGYRYPQGRFNHNLIPFFKEMGLKYDSSIFPSIRPGVFDFSKMPQNPFLIDGLLELPLASFLKIRTIFSLSCVIIFGEMITKLKMNLFGLPNVLVIDGHMTDIIDVPSLSMLPMPIRLAYGRNRGKGIAIMEYLIEALREMGYEFVTVRQIYEQCMRENA